MHKDFQPSGAELSLFESVLCGIVRYSLNENPEVLQFNQACAQIYGYKTRAAFAEALELQPNLLVYFYDKEIMRGFIRRCMRTGQTINFGHRIQRQDQSLAYIMGTLSPFTLDDGTPSIQAVFMDSGQRVVREDVRKSILYTPSQERRDDKKIVVVGSCKQTRSDLRCILQRDYMVIEAQSSEEILSILSKENDEVSAVLADIDIVAERDYRFMATLKSNLVYASIPVIVLADENIGSEEELLSYGANEFFRRPYNPNVIRLRLANLIELRDTAIQRNAVESLINNIPGGVAIFRISTRLEMLFASPSLAHLGGYSKDAALARSRKGHLEQWIYEPDRQRVMTKIFSCAKRGLPVEITFRLLNKKSKPIWVHTHAAKIQNDDDCPLYQAVISPTTLSEKMYQGIMDDAFCAIVINDNATGELLFINNEAASLISPDDPDSISPTGTDVLWEPYKNDALILDTYCAKQLVLPSVGRHLTMNAKLMDWNGIRARIIYATDDTERYRQQNEQLETALNAAKQANAAKSIFLSRMSHDIRTPMNAILGMSHLAQDESENLASIRDYLQKISSSGEYLLGLINDILDMSKMESDRIELFPESYSIKECVDFVLVSMRTQMDQKHLTFAYEEKDISEQSVLLDKMRTQQIFFNLLSNAVKFTPEGGRIGIFVIQLMQTAQAVRYRVTVEDNGIGISASQLRQIFEPFEQAGSPNASSQPGTGLGLAIVRSLVHLMNGTIWVESKPNEGSRFIFEIEAPVDTNAGAFMPTLSVQKPAETVYDFSGKKVLLAEDHPLNMELACRILQKTHCTVETAENGSIAVEKILASAPSEYQAVLMDIRMPVMDGLAATRRIRSCGRKDLQTIPIIAMTANAFAEDVRASRNAGMNAHITKPIDMHLLYQTLNEIWS